jgi:hypothetical protein
MFPWPHCHIFFDGSNTAPIVESRSILERCSIVEMPLDQSRARQQAVSR